MKTRQLLHVISGLLGKLPLWLIFFVQSLFHVALLISISFVTSLGFLAVTVTHLEISSYKFT